MRFDPCHFAIWRTVFISPSMRLHRRLIPLMGMAADLQEAQLFVCTLGEVSLKGSHVSCRIRA